MKKNKECLKIPRPSKKEVERYLKIWDKNSEYKEPEKALLKLFKEIIPRNNNLAEILIKVSSLDILYSTGVKFYSLTKMAQHILDKKIDYLLVSGDVDVISKIAIVDGRNFYVFATKYCNHHNPKKYPMYDSYVDKLLWCFESKYHFGKFTREKLRDYSDFKIILTKFITHFGLGKFKLRDIDKYLWLVGKEFF